MSVYFVIFQKKNCICFMVFAKKLSEIKKQIYQEKHIHVHEFVIDTFCVSVYSYELMRFNIYSWLSLNSINIWLFMNFLGEKMEVENF